MPVGKIKKQKIIRRNVKMKSKKIIALLLTAVMLLSMAACGQKTATDKMCIRDRFLPEPLLLF